MNKSSAIRIAVTFLILIGAIVFLLSQIYWTRSTLGLFSKRWETGNYTIDRYIFSQHIPRILDTVTFKKSINQTPVTYFRVYANRLACPPYMPDLNPNVGFEKCSYYERTPVLEGLELGKMIYTPDSFNVETASPVIYSPDMWIFLKSVDYENPGDYKRVFNYWIRAFLEDSNTPTEVITRLALELEFEKEPFCFIPSLFANHPNTPIETLRVIAKLGDGGHDDCKASAKIAARRIAQSGDPPPVYGILRDYTRKDLGFEFKIPVSYKIEDEDTYKGNWSIVLRSPGSSAPRINVDLSKLTSGYYASFDSFKNELWTTSEKYAGNFDASGVTEGIINGVSVIEKFIVRDGIRRSTTYFWIGSDKILYFSLRLEDPIVQSVKLLDNKTNE